jgi:hypothetical protein
VSSKFLTLTATGTWCALAISVALLLGHTAPVVAATVQVSTEVPAGKTKTVRLRRLPRGAIVAVRVRSSGALQVALVSALALKSPDPKSLFRGALESKLTFQVVVPASSDYYLMLDNRRGSKTVQVETTISAKKGAATPPRPPPDKPELRPGGKLEQTSAALVPHA